MILGIPRRRVLAVAACCVIAFLAIASAPPAGARQPDTSPTQQDFITPDGTPTAGQAQTFTWKNRHTKRPTIQVVCEQPQSPDGGYGIVYLETLKEPGAVFPMTPTGSEPFSWDFTQPANCSADLMRNTPNGWVSDARSEFVAQPSPIVSPPLTPIDPTGHTSQVLIPPNTVSQATVQVNACQGLVTAGPYIFNYFAKLDHLNAACLPANMRITLVIYIPGWGLRNIPCDFGDPSDAGCFGSVELRSEQATITANGSTFFGWRARLCSGLGCGEIAASIYG